MAFNSEIKGYMTFGKSFSRGGAFPLEAYEIWTDYDALVAYAANTDPAKDPSYIGQKVAYVDLENNKVTHYGIEIDGTLKELGASPIGDEKSIVIGENNTISLKGVDGLVFERDIIGEGGQPTGQKENVQFQPLMTKDGLIWVEPSKTTVEGLASLIDGLTARVSALENDRVTEQELADAIAGVEAKIDAVDFVDEDELAEAIKDFATDTEVADAVKVEKERAEAAEKALGERIDGIDFVDTDELNTALEPYAKTADVNAALAEKAKQTDLEALQNRVDAFLTGEGTEAALDSLQELIAYIDSHDDVDIAGILEDIQGLEDKLAGIDTTVAAYVTSAIEALKIGDYAKASDLADLATRVKALEDVDNFTQAEFNTFKTENDQAIATAKQEAIDAAALAVTNAAYATKAELTAHEEAAAEAYATKAELTAHEEAAAETYATKQALADHKTEADGKYATKQALADHETAATNTYATKEFVGNFTTGEDAYKDITSIVGYINKKAEETLAAAQGGSSETAASVALALQNYKNENDPKVQKNANDIAAIQGQLGTTNTNVSSNATEIGKINTEITTGIKPRLEALEGADEVIEETLAEHTAAIKTINETTIPALQGTVNTKAAQSDVDAINAKIGTVEEGKTVVDMINAVAGTIDFTPYAKKDDVAATYATKAELEAEASRADAAEKANAQAIADLTNGAVKKNTDDIAAINALLNTVDSEDTITSLKELAIWVEEHETEVLPVIEQQGKDIEALGGRLNTVETAVNTTLPGAIAQALVDAKAYTDEKMVKADGTSIVNNEGTFSVGAVSTDKLVQGTMTLVLNGGSAEVKG